MKKLCTNINSFAVVCMVYKGRIELLKWFWLNRKDKQNKKEEKIESKLDSIEIIHYVHAYVYMIILNTYHNAVKVLLSLLYW